MTLRIEGSGPVALACALFALRQGYGTDDIDLAFDPSPVPSSVAGRVLAISEGSWQLLSRIMTLPRAAAIETVDVRVLGHPGRTRITAHDMGVPALGHVVRYGDLHEQLARAARDARLARTVTAGEPEAIVHAEGDTGEDARVREFEQTALLAEVTVGSSHTGTAFECFTAHGPLALLPLPEPRRYSLIWCAEPQENLRRSCLDLAALAGELQAAFGGALGALSIERAPLVWPLARRARRELVRANEVWIGNSAQTLHPVAGQGLNLGLRDAFLLAAHLGDARAAHAGAASALRAWAADRRLDRGGTIALTDTLARGFALSPLRPLQSALLAYLDVSPRLRRAVGRQFMFGIR